MLLKKSEGQRLAPEIRRQRVQERGRRIRTEAGAQPAIDLLRGDAERRARSSMSAGRELPGSGSPVKKRSDKEKTGSPAPAKGVAAPEAGQPTTPDGTPSRGRTSHNAAASRG